MNLVVVQRAAAAAAAAGDPREILRYRAAINDPGASLAVAPAAYVSAYVSKRNSDKN